MVYSSAVQVYFGKDNVLNFMQHKRLPIPCDEKS